MSSSASHQSEESRESRRASLCVHALASSMACEFRAGLRTPLASASARRPGDPSPPGSSSGTPACAEGDCAPPRHRADNGVIDRRGRRRILLVFQLIAGRRIASEGAHRADVTNGHDQRSERVSDRLSMGFNTSSRPRPGAADTVAVLPRAIMMGFHLFTASRLEMQEDRVRQRSNLLT